MKEYKFNQLKDKFQKVGYKSIKYTYKIHKGSGMLLEKETLSKELDYLFYLKTKIADNDQKL